MDQQKIGFLLRELRKQKGLTQEQFAETVNVSNRTVSRWENGRNLPDLDILIEISDYFEIDLRELLDGEMRAGKMNWEADETALKAAEYTNSETECYTKRVHWLLFAGAAFWFTALLIQHTELIQITLMRNLSDFSEGAACGMLLCGILVTGKYRKRLQNFKKRLWERQ